MHHKLLFLWILALLMVACGGRPPAGPPNTTADTVSNNNVNTTADIPNETSANPDAITVTSARSICQGRNDFSQIPAAYVAGLTRYTTLNTHYLVNVCTEDSNGDGRADYMVVESTDQPEHESIYFPEGHVHHEPFDFNTNIYKFAAVYTNQRAHSAGNNQIEEQAIIMKMPITPRAASNKTATTYDTIGLALNGVAFFNENARPGDEITDELFTFDQCSGHPQQQGTYHYHVDPVCLIRDLGGDVLTETSTADGTGYTWLTDAGTNAGLLLGFLMDGFPVYGPLGATAELDCAGAAVSTPIDAFNGHEHCTAEFPTGIYHYHVKTANSGGANNPVFWITNEYYYGEPGTLGR